MLPTFFIVGAQKSGTSSLWSYLGRHPEVFVTGDKEPRFFVEERAWRRGRSWYEGLFAAAGDARARGEASTDYSVFPTYAGVPERIASVVPEARIIYLMRDPIERMRSSYHHSLSNGVERRPIATALLEDARYLYQSQYAMQVGRYLEHFARSQVLLVTAEELRKERSETVARVLEFLGVDPGIEPENLETEYNASDGRTKPRWWARRVGDGLAALQADDGLPAPIRPLVVTVGRVLGPRSREPIHSHELDLDEELRARLAVVLRPDLEALRRHMGAAFDCWGLLD